LVGDMSFGTVHFPGWKEFSIGELDETIFVAADTGELFDMAVPGGEIVVADGPGGCDAVAGWAFEFELAPALGLAGPEGTFATYLVTADPVEGFFLYIGVRFIGNEEVFGGFAVGVTTAEYGVV